MKNYQTYNQLATVATLGTLLLLGGTGSKPFGYDVGG